MKLYTNQQNLYSIKQMACSLNMHKSSIKYRIKTLKLEPVLIEKDTFYYSFESFQLVRNLSNITVVEVPSIVEVPSVVYVQETYFFYHSKLNFLNLNQL